MTVTTASKDVSSAAIYLPKINRAVVDQLEAHLRAIRFPTTQRTPLSLADDVSQMSMQLRPDQLESTLRRVETAARVMTVLSEQTLASEERDRLQDVIGYLERKIGLFKQAFEALFVELTEARREADDFRCRSHLAEQKLEVLVEAVTRNIGPVNSQYFETPSRGDAGRHVRLRDNEDRV